jgi:hypothetical protein
MKMPGRIVAIAALLALGGIASAQTSAQTTVQQSPADTADQQPSGTVPSSQTRAQAQPGAEIQEEPVDSTQQSQDIFPGTPKVKQQGDLPKETRVIQRK